MKKGSVLVTGASGFVGSTTVEALTQAGWKVTSGQRTIPKFRDGHYLKLDLDNPIELLKLADTCYFDAIVHLGTHVGWYSDSSARMFVPNVLATACLSELAKHWKSHVIFASAAIVCGASNEHITALLRLN